MIGRRLVAGVLAATLALAAAMSIPAAAQPVRLRVVHVPVLIFAPLYVAIERGYFAREGIEVELITTPGGVSSFAVLAGGRAEVVVGGLGAALFNAAARGLDFKVVGPVHMERPPVSTPLVISKKAWDSGEIRSVRDLRGRKVSVNVLGSATEFWLHSALLRGGLTIDDVDLVAVNFPEVPAALANGAIAAGLLGEPLATLAEDRGQIHRLSQDFIDGVQVTALYYSGQFMRAHPRQAVGFMVAWLRASRDLFGDGYRRDDVARIVEKYTGVPAAVVKRAAAPYHEPNGKMNFNDFKRLQEFFRKRGALTYDRPLEPSQYIDTTYVREALQILGPFAPPR
ncbi:MAG: ABC transporter substrate-binding protein [Armatimonadota bacterium]|nr:ABC transporter substrate-binding protein [Armatimonadota bacterium]MDR7438014.1 ABC transporter substrate-binding protein [Armatimonadota bacterium]MDR7471826.1 ABC transporter substrate-binding protein [Armatimonadota bacterium]MDR7507827.1 ABC transporter substrate-binding protein [Armatimonadota bacterium]MDR7510140.1 ABC transporter substrate-binding protein [Armatimonadota bacterium]